VSTWSSRARLGAGLCMILRVAYMKATVQFEKIVNTAKIRT
jgi:hypothetical protein